MAAMGASAIQELEQWMSQSSSPHAALELLRERGDDRCLFLRSILELQKQPMLPAHMEELLFHCILGCRHVLLGQWQQSYSLSFLCRVRDYLMLYGHAMPHRIIRLACYTTTASFWKRAWIHNENGSNENQTSHHPLESMLLSDMSSLAASNSFNTKEDLFSYLNMLMVQGQQHAAELLECIVCELGGKSTAVQYRMPLEFHKRVHKAFETQFGLFESLQIAVTSLSQIESSNTLAADSTISILQLINSILAWEFGTSAWDSLVTTGSIIRPPAAWSAFIGQVNVVHALFRMHDASISGSGSSHRLPHIIRQILLQLASLSGPIFLSPSDRSQYAAAICEGCLALFQQVTVSVVVDEESTILLDIYQIQSRLVTNFRLPLLLEIASFPLLLKCGTDIGCTLLMDHMRECDSAGGDIEAIAHWDFREEALGQLLECAVLISGDHWLWHGGGTDESRYLAQKRLSDILCHLYDGFVLCRLRIAVLEEKFFAENESDLDETREGITEAELLEEIDSIASIGRLDLSKSLGCLSTVCGKVLQQLHSLWETSGDVTPEVSAALEEARLLTLYISHLLTDGSKGESPSIPDTVMLAGIRRDNVVQDIVGAVQAMFQIADLQVRKLVIDPSNARLSPLLAKALLCFLNRWAPAYIYPVDLDATLSSSRLVQEWSSLDRAQQTIEFCVSLCSHYLCYWPQEPPVRELVSQLIFSLARRGGAVRNILISAPSFLAIVRCHCLVAGIPLTIPPSEFEATVGRTSISQPSAPSIAMLWGYQRLPYKTKASLLTAILIACSDSNDIANPLMTESLQVMHQAFAQLSTALQHKNAKEDIHVREMVCLGVDLLGGVATASEMHDAERIPLFLTPFLPQLSSLMAHYANDMTVCESLLRFFCDYTAHFIAVLDGEQSRILFQSSAELLRSYSVHHWSSTRVVKSKTEALAEEEQTYSDIICAIQLLTNLGTKDFIDACQSPSSSTDTLPGVTDMIFYGVQQILPLMTQGLLQYPKLCSLFFELLGFLCDTYPDQVCALPRELLDALVEALLFGMRHVEAPIGTLSLQGLASLAREANFPWRDRCTQRLLSDLVYATGSALADRTAAAGTLLWVLATADPGRFAAVVAEGSQGLAPEPRRRLDAAYQKLLRPDVLSLPAQRNGGYEGRMRRVAFQMAFASFVQEIQAFLVLQ